MALTGSVAATIPAIHRLRDDALANTSYLLEVDDGHAVTIDPPRDVDRHLELAAHLGVQIVATLDTHVHADYLSGATELAARGRRRRPERGGSPISAPPDRRRRATRHRRGG